MKNHLFCVGIEFKKASDPSESYAYVTAYLTRITDKKSP